MKTLSNEKVTIQLSEHGAELTSIVAGDNEYLWQADPKFWARHSPVLFPFVGRVWNNTYRHEGKAYPMGQHGFARDMDFQLSYEEEDAVVFSLESDEQTFAKYPFRFVLEIGYRLKGNCIEVMWNVQNIALFLWMKLIKLQRKRIRLQEMSAESLYSKEC